MDNTKQFLNDACLILSHLKKELTGTDLELVEQFLLSMEFEEK